MLNDKQVQRVFALYDSIKKLPDSRKQEGIDAAIQFFKDNNMVTKTDPVVALGKLKSKYKTQCIRKLLDEKQDIYDLYKKSYVHNEDILHYLGIDKIKNS